MMQNVTTELIDWYHSNIVMIFKEGGSGLCNKKWMQKCSIDQEMLEYELWKKVMSSVWLSELNEELVIEQQDACDL
jgi:hypothetical protein